MPPIQSSFFVPVKGNPHSLEPNDFFGSLGGEAPDNFRLTKAVPRKKGIFSKAVWRIVFAERSVETALSDS
jgi:hypothetical protein